LREVARGPRPREVLRGAVEEVQLVGHATAAHAVRAVDEPREAARLVPVHPDGIADSLAVDDRPDVGIAGRRAARRGHAPELARADRVLPGAGAVAHVADAAED